MAVFAKPFNWANKIVKTIFGGKPTIFSAQDLNRYLDVLSNYQAQMSTHLGILRENWYITFSIVEANPPILNGSGVWVQDKTITIDFTKPNVGEGAYVYAKGTRFEIPTGTISNTIQIRSELKNTEVYLCLVATKKTIKYGDSPVMHIIDPNEFSGVRGVDFPGTLPAADNVVYGDERLVITSDANPALGPDEELIGILCTLHYKEIFSNTYLLATFPTTNTNLQGVGVTYNAYLLDELMSYLPNPTDLISGYQIYKSNGSISEALNHFIATTLRAISQISEELASKTNALSNISNSLSSLGYQVGVLSDRVIDNNVLDNIVTLPHDGSATYKYAPLCVIKLSAAGDSFHGIFSLSTRTGSTNKQPHSLIFAVSLTQVAAPDAGNTNSTRVEIRTLSDNKDNQLGFTNISYPFVATLVRTHNNSTDGAMFRIYGGMNHQGAQILFKELASHIIETTEGSVSKTYFHPLPTGLENDPGATQGFPQWLAYLDGYESNLAYEYISTINDEVSLPFNVFTQIWAYTIPNDGRTRQRYELSIIQTCQYGEIYGTTNNSGVAPLEFGVYVNNVLQGTTFEFGDITASPNVIVNTKVYRPQVSERRSFVLSPGDTVSYKIKRNYDDTKLNNPFATRRRIQLIKNTN